MVVGIVAALKAGAAYVPLDPGYPRERLAFMLEDSGAKCLVSDSSLLGGLALAQGLALLRLDRDGAEFERFDDVHPPPQPSPARGEGERGEARPDNLCCVIYTSGTTGRPKGVMLEHRNVVALVRAEAGLYGARSDDRVFQLASAAFDASIEEIWLAFLQGATLVAATDELRRPGPEFCRELDRLGVTILSCVPTFLSMIEGDLRRVRVLILGGEACPADLAARWLRPGRALFNTYGPTEATVIATAALLEQGRPVTIGRPIEGYSAYLLDP
ncbi:MAG: AMP-binding protein, partial [Elusimicrobia bacterium]|nr:AMP-binding protein [Elusimicrobiota bacterium]